MSWRHLDELMWHNRRCVKLTHIIVVISLSLDGVASGDNKHGELGNLQHHILLVFLVKARVAFLAKQPLIFNMLNDVLVFKAPIVVDIELVFNVLLNVIDLDDALNLNILINRSLRSPILIFNWTMMNDRFYRWMTVLLILLIVDMAMSMIVHHLVNGNSKCAWASICSMIWRRCDM